jgi:hypothetical protein
MGVPSERTIEEIWKITTQFVIDFSCNKHLQLQIVLVAKDKCHCASCKRHHVTWEL